MKAETLFGETASPSPTEFQQQSEASDDRVQRTEK
jgi:hypothetical protein